MPRAPKVKGSFLWWLPAPPKSPDYSTPQAVSLRAFERGECPGWTVKMYRLLLTDGKLYKDLMAAVAVQPKAGH